MISNERLKEICDSYYNNVYHYCFSKIRNVHDAKDITQEVFKLLVEKAPDLDDKNLKAWLYDVAMLKTKESFKKRKSSSKIISLDDSNIFQVIEDRTQYSLDIEVILDNTTDEEIESKKDQILSRITPEEFELYTDIVVHKKKYKEIADEKGISAKAVNVRAFRLKQKIREIIKSSFAVLFICSFINNFIK